MSALRSASAASRSGAWRRSWRCQHLWVSRRLRSCERRCHQWAAPNEQEATTCHQCPNVELTPHGQEHVHAGSRQPAAACCTPDARRRRWAGDAKHGCRCGDAAGKSLAAQHTTAACCHSTPHLAALSVCCREYSSGALPMQVAILWNRRRRISMQEWMHQLAQTLAPTMMPSGQQPRDRVAC
jgi:hypothetical protein